MIIKLIPIPLFVAAAQVPSIDDDSDSEVSKRPDVSRRLDPFQDAIILRNKLETSNVFSIAITFIH